MQNYLLSSAKCKLQRHEFRNLLGTETTLKQLCDQLANLSRGVFDGYTAIDTAQTEYYLNKIALKVPKTACEKAVRNAFDDFWQRFCQVKDALTRPHLRFPSNKDGSRLMQICSLVAKCTLFACDLHEIERNVCSNCDISQMEKAYLFDALTLAKINYYCAVTLNLWHGGPRGEERIAKLLDVNPLDTELTSNDVYCQTALCGGAHVVNCLGESAFAVGDKPSCLHQTMQIFAGSRNVFDTFCRHAFGNRTAVFSSSNKQIDVKMRYFAQKNVYVRNFSVTNKGKTKLYEIDFSLDYTGKNRAEYFFTDSALCVAVSGSQNYFFALSVVQNNQLVPLKCDGKKCYFEQKIAQNQTITFDVVGVCAESMPLIAEKTDGLTRFGATKCPYLFDSPAKSDKTGAKMHVTACSNFFKSEDVPKPTMFNFTEKANGNGVSMLTGDGYASTLINGFAFGIGGEKLYAVSSGKAVPLLTSGNVCGDTVTYKTNFGKNIAETVVQIGDGKTVNVSFLQKSRLLALFPLEETSQISYNGCTFFVQSASRKFEIAFDGKVESFTTNVFEINENRLRYKLSNTLETGKCLAVCLAPSQSFAVKITAESTTAVARPLATESLVSTYLNYVNGKNVFCLQNRLKYADALTLASAVYTYPDFVRQYLAEHTDGVSHYYDVAGKLQRHCDSLAFALGVIYYAKLTGDDFFRPYYKQIENDVYTEKTGTALCIKTLALKKMATLDGFDKMRAVCEYQKALKAVTSDKKLYGYAQSIGAVTLLAPSKERLKDLCTTYGVPKCFYYVSQLENLYGIAVNGDSLNVAPQTSDVNSLEQLTLCFGKKKINTTFVPSKTQSMSLNGVTFFQAFRPSSLKNDVNTLVVGYK